MPNLSHQPSYFQEKLGMNGSTLNGSSESHKKNPITEQNKHYLHVPYTYVYWQFISHNLAYIYFQFIPHKYILQIGHTRQCVITKEKFTTGV